VIHRVSGGQRAQARATLVGGVGICPLGRRQRIANDSQLVTHRDCPGLDADAPDPPLSQAAAPIEPSGPAGVPIRVIWTPPTLAQLGSPASCCAEESASSSNRHDERFVG